MSLTLQVRVTMSYTHRIVVFQDGRARDWPSAAVPECIFPYGRFKFLTDRYAPGCGWEAPYAVRPTRTVQRRLVANVESYSHRQMHLESFKPAAE